MAGYESLCGDFSKVCGKDSDFERAAILLKHRADVNIITKENCK